MCAQRILPTFTTDRLVLRRAQPSDALGRLALGYDQDIQILYGDDQQVPLVFDQSYADHWVQRQIDEPHTWIIEESGRLLGCAKFHSWNIYDRRAELGLILLDRDTHGAGRAKEALAPIISYGFSKMRLHRISARILADNVRALGVFQGLGFQVEGRERESARMSGAYQDDIILGLLSSEYATRTTV